MEEFPFRAMVVTLIVTIVFLVLTVFYLIHAQKLPQPGAITETKIQTHQKSEEPDLGEFKKSWKKFSKRR